MRAISLASGLALSLAALVAGVNGGALGHEDHKIAANAHANAQVAAAATESKYINNSRKPKKRKRRKNRSRWGANHFPNVTLTTQDGKKVRFFDDLIKDKVVMINFIYTNCPDVCSVETARLLNVREILGDRVGKDIFMYSITIDPDHDTPEVLKKYKEKFGIGEGWTFLTGKEEDTLLLREKLGLYLPGLDSKGPSTDHNVSLVIGNQTTGQWMKRSPFDDPSFLATQVGSWLGSWRRPEDANTNSYRNAPELRTTTLGENLFRTRCTSCHTIGTRNFRDLGRRKLGPDLDGVVAKRDPAWLARWLAEPDKMIAEKDPLALKIVAEYNNVPMPNLRLGKNEVDALIKFMADEDKITTAQQKAKPSPQTAKAAPTLGKEFEPRPIDGRFELADSKGRVVTNKDFLGKWMMVFFGYTFCPDVCPTTLNNIAVAMEQLGDGAKDVQPIFISVDPKRENPSDLAEYTAAFDPRIKGLTGTTAQIAAASKSYNAYFKKIGDTEDYLMDHSPMVYLIGPDGQYVTRFGHRMGPDDITAKMREFFTASKEQLNPKRAALAK